MSKAIELKFFSVQAALSIILSVVELYRSGGQGVAVMNAVGTLDHTTHWGMTHTRSLISWMSLQGVSFRGVIPTDFSIWNLSPGKCRRLGVVGDGGGVRGENRALQISINYHPDFSVTKRTSYLDLLELDEHIQPHVNTLFCSCEGREHH